MDTQQLLMYGGRLLAAFALAVPVAWEREHSTRIMGLRTFPLVALASCGYVLVATAVTGEEDADARARALQGLMTGIGFIGGGAILKRKSGVRGTATAASVWSTGAIGAAAGFGEYAIAALVALINYAALLVLTPIEKRLGKHNRGAADRPRQQAPTEESGQEERG